MTDTSTDQYNESLGIGEIIGDTFSIFVGNIPAIAILGCLPSLITLAVIGLLFGNGYLTGEIDADTSGFSTLIVTILSMAAYGVTSALLVQMAYDAKIGRPVTPARYIQPALSSVVPIVILTLVATIAMGIAFVALIVPGLWVYAVFSVFIPAIVIDRAGFAALGRSIALTKEYRWPIIGLTLVIWIIAAVVNLGGLFLTGLIGGGLLVNIVILSIVYGLAYSISGISVALLYARLREIKEGASVSDLVAIFD
ncbi:MAG: hypothetical protein ABJN26_14480 [Stappiaceae bacterium]